MKTLLATTAVILATATTAMADPTGGSATGGTGSEDTAPTYEELQAELDTANHHIGFLQDSYNQLNAIRISLVNNNTILQNEVMDAYEAVDAAQAEQATQTAYIDQVIADNSGYTSFGDVWSTFGYQGLTPTGEKAYKDHSYDLGITNVTIDSNVTTTSYAVVSNVEIKGKYHDFDIELDSALSDVEIRDTEANKLAFMNVIEQVKNISYNEGYKDGFNDGYEKGFFDGKTSILTQLQN